MGTGDVLSGISFCPRPDLLDRARGGIAFQSTNGIDGGRLVFMAKDDGGTGQLKVSTDKKMEILPDGQVNAGISNLTTNAVVGINNFHDSGRLSGPDICGGHSITRKTGAVRNTTVDVWWARHADNTTMPQALISRFYIQIGGGNGYFAMYDVCSTSAGASNFTFTEVTTRTRGINPVSSIQLAADGSAGAVKLTVTYVDQDLFNPTMNAFVTFIGQCG